MRKGYLTRQLLVWVALLTGYLGAPVAAQSIGQSTHSVDSADHLYCMKQYIAARSSNQPLGVAPAQAEQIVNEIAATLSLSASTIRVVACFEEQAATALYRAMEAPGLPAGEYLIYNPRWVTQMVGEDRWKLVFIFAHELAHFMNRDFTARANISTDVREREADRFGGCAVARLGGSWSSLSDVVSRLRQLSDKRYPDQKSSLAAAEEGFRKCSSASPQHAGDSSRSRPEFIRDGLKFVGNIARRVPNSGNSSAVISMTNLGSKEIRVVVIGEPPPIMQDTLGNASANWAAQIAGLGYCHSGLGGLRWAATAKNCANPELFGSSQWKSIAPQETIDVAFTFSQFKLGGDAQLSFALLKTTVEPGAQSLAPQLVFVTVRGIGLTTSNER